MLRKEFVTRTLAPGAALLAATLAPAAAYAQSFDDVKPSAELRLKGQGSFFVGGNTHYVPAPYAYSAPGNVMINQMYVEFMKPSDRNKQFPIIFVHGCGLSSKTWETTPDGRMGWNEYFVRKGFDTYMADQVGRARSGFNGLKYEVVRAGDAPASSQPEIRLATDAFAWATFRFGDYATLTPWPDERFPMKTVGVGPGSTLDFYKQVIPDMYATLDTSPPGCTGGGCYTPIAADFHNTSAAMAELANDLGGAILVGHSQSSSYPTRAALQSGSHGVKGIIQLETGCFDNLTDDDIQILKKIPILIMEGDHYVEADGVTPQAKPPAACVTQLQQINAAGGDMTYIHLPAIGIHGNSHMFMQDNNNLKIADILIKWIDQHVRTSGGPGHGGPGHGGPGHGGPGHGGPGHGGPGHGGHGHGGHGH
jgi:hypothetical protein